MMVLRRKLVALRLARQADHGQLTRCGTRLEQKLGRLQVVEAGGLEEPVVGPAFVLEVTRDKGVAPEAGDREHGKPVAFRRERPVPNPDGFRSVTSAEVCDAGGFLTGRVPDACFALMELDSHGPTGRLQGRRAACGRARSGTATMYASSRNAKVASPSWASTERLAAVSLTHIVRAAIIVVLCVDAGGSKCCTFGRERRGPRAALCIGWVILDPACAGLFEAVGERPSQVFGTSPVCDEMRPPMQSRHARRQQTLQQCGFGAQVLIGLRQSSPGGRAGQGGKFHSRTSGTSGGGCSS